MGSNDELIERAARMVSAAWKGGRHTLVFAPPKSASTFFCNVLAASMRIDMGTYNDVVSGPNSFSLSQAIAISGRKVVARVHAQYSASTEILIKATGSAPIVLRRDLESSLLSMANHRLQRGGSIFDAKLKTLDRDDQVRITAYEWLSWFVHFEESWLDQSRRRKVLILDFKDIVADPIACVHKALGFHGLDISVSAVEDAAKRVDQDRKLSNRTEKRPDLVTEIPEDVRRMIKTFGLIRT